MIKLVDNIAIRCPIVFICLTIFIGPKLNSWPIVHILNHFLSGEIVSDKYVVQYLHLEKLNVKIFAKR